MRRRNLDRNSIFSVSKELEFAVDEFDMSRYNDKRWKMIGFSSSSPLEVSKIAAKNGRVRISSDTQDHGKST